MFMKLIIIILIILININYIYKNKKLINLKNIIERKLKKNNSDLEIY